MSRTADGRTVFTTGQVAKALHFAPRTVSKLFDKGMFPKSWRIPGGGGKPGDRRIPRNGFVQFCQRNGLHDQCREVLRDVSAIAVVVPGSADEDVNQILDGLREQYEERVEVVHDLFSAGSLFANFRMMHVFLIGYNNPTTLARVQATLSQCEGCELHEIPLPPRGTTSATGVNTIHGPGGVN